MSEKRLYHISESQSSHASHRLAIGIDLGTTHSLVALVKDDHPYVLANNDGHLLLPSVVHYSDNHIEVGHKALKAMTTDPLNTIVSVKRMIGREMAEITTLDSVLPYHFVDSPGMVKVQTVAGNLSPVQISSDILKVLKAGVEKHEQQNLFGAVITVPAYFNDSQRQATKDAAKLAGIRVLRLINEPTAAALAYGLDHRQGGTIAVYDLGGGTFDISILHMEQGIFTVLATGGDSALGGDDMDYILANWLLNKPLGVANQNTDATLSVPNEVRKHIAKARFIKEELTTKSSVMVDGQTMSRDTLNDLISSLVRRTLMICKQVLQDANLQASDIDDIIMVGGATRIPYIQQQITTFFGQQPLQKVDPDQVVALGAAIQADILAGNKKSKGGGNDILLLDVVPLSLGIETMGGLYEVIIPRNTTMPVVRSQTFTTFKDGQTSLMIHVLQGERELACDCRSLAHITLTNIPPFPAGVPRIVVSFQVDMDGLLTVSAVEQMTDHKTQVQVKPSYGLTEDDMLAMLEKAYSHAQTDIKKRRYRELQVQAEQLGIAVRKALTEDGDLLDFDQKLQIDNMLITLEKEKLSNNINALGNAINVLNQLTQSFAMKRMTKALQTALHGKTIIDVQKMIDQ